MSWQDKTRGFLKFCDKRQSCLNLSVMNHQILPEVPNVFESKIDLKTPLFLILFQKRIMIFLNKFPLKAQN